MRRSKSFARKLIGTSGLTVIASFAFGAMPAFASEVAVDPPLFFEGPGSTLSIDGDSDDDAVAVSLSGGTITITDTGTGGITTSDPDCTQVNPTTVTCPYDPADPPAPDPPADPVTRTSVVLVDGNDSFSTSVDVFGNFVMGNEGNDTLSGGPDEDTIVGDSGDDVLDGGGGDDGVNGGFGNDTLRGGDGDDFLDDGGFGTVTGGVDTLDGGNGEDSAFYSRELPLFISLNGVADDGFAGEGDNLTETMENVTGGDKNDTLTGNDSQNDLDGADGADVIFGLGGPDDVIGRSGDDSLIGGLGGDDYLCGSGFDTAMLDPDDEFDINCERVGARATVDTATVSKKNRMRAPVLCPASEAAACAGKLRLFLNGKHIGSGRFNVAAGESDKATMRLSKRGRRAMARNGGTLLATVHVRTNIGIGASVRDDELLLRRKAAQK